MTIGLEDLATRWLEAETRSHGEPANIAVRRRGREPGRGIRGGRRGGDPGGAAARMGGGQPSARRRRRSGAAAGPTPGGCPSCCGPSTSPRSRRPKASSSRLTRRGSSRRRARSLRDSSARAPRGDAGSRRLSRARVARLSSRLASASTRPPRIRGVVTVSSTREPSPSGSIRIAGPDPVALDHLERHPRRRVPHRHLGDERPVAEEQVPELPATAAEAGRRRVDPAGLPHVRVPARVVLGVGDEREHRLGRRADVAAIRGGRHD